MGDDLPRHALAVNDGTVRSRTSTHGTISNPLPLAADARLICWNRSACAGGDVVFPEGVTAIFALNEPVGQGTRSLSPNMRLHQARRRTFRMLLVYVERAVT